MARLRKIKPAAGLSGRIEYTGSYEVPGWPGGLEVVVVDVQGDAATVRDLEGRERAFSLWQLEVGFEFEFDGEWVHESHPRALDEAAGMLGALLTRPATDESLEAELEAIRICEDLLDRYGRAT
jgi:hypothetical protein